MSTTATKRIPIGVAEIAEMLGVKQRTVHQWHHRGILPERDFTVNDLPAWKPSTIIRWAKSTGRLPE